MLNPDDRRAIEGLFSRLRDVERRTDARDPEAEALIREEISRQPDAPYYMAQTILVQEHALSVAERRIAELEAQLERRPNDFLGGLFGGRDTPRAQYRPPARQERGPWDRNDRHADNRGGGFLAGAAQTALGVTGGLLLGSAIGSLFGAGAAQAEEAPADQQQDQQGTDQPDSGSDSGDADFGGGDFGDGGGFDMGGDF
ncbi:MAG: DUF2076 domain-containing protein [Devosia sp.]